MSTNEISINTTGLVFVAGTTDKEKQKVLKDIEIVNKTLVAYASSYVKLCKALSDFDRTGSYKKLINPETKKHYSDVKDFAKLNFKLERSAVNDSIKIYRRFFEVLDENGNYINKPIEINGVTADKFPKTSLVLLSTLKDDEYKNAEKIGITPNMKTKEIKSVIDKVHVKKGKNGANTDKEKKHPCQSMDIDAFTTYMRDAFSAFSISDACKLISDTSDKTSILTAFNAFIDTIDKAIDKAVNTETHEVHNEPTDAAKAKINGKKSK